MIYLKSKKRLAKDKKQLAAGYNLYMLDIHLANACNLMCYGCNHWSNYGFQEIFDRKTLKDWATPWASRLIPERINLLGGEPLLNKETEQIVSDYAKLFPKSKLKLFTNGFLLSKNLQLKEVLEKTDTSLVITLHSRDERYLKKLKKEILSLNDWGSTSHKKKTWFRTVYDIGGVEVEIRDMKNHWYKTYTGDGYNAKPYADNNPKKSWEICVSKESVQLYKYNLYKCGPIAYLNDFLDKYNLSNDPDWISYYNYKPLKSKCTESELSKFLSTKEENICNMCPTNPKYFDDKEVFNRIER